MAWLTVNMFMASSVSFWLELGPMQVLVPVKTFTAKRQVKSCPKR